MNTTLNVGISDRVLRVSLGIFFGLMYFSGIASGTLGIVLLVVGIILVLTGLVRICPAYMLLGINTCPVEKKNRNAKGRS